MDHLKRSEGGIVGKKKTGKENGWIIQGGIIKIYGSGMFMYGKEVQYFLF